MAVVCTFLTVFTGSQESSPLMYAVGEDQPWNQLVVEFLELRFAGFTSIAVPAFIVSYIFFFGIGGFLHVSAYKITKKSIPSQVVIPPFSWLNAL